MYSIFDIYEDELKDPTIDHEPAHVQVGPWYSNVYGTYDCPHEPLPLVPNREVVLSITDTHIVWKYADEVEWRPLLDITDVPVMEIIEEAIYVAGETL